MTEPLILTWDRSVSFSSSKVFLSNIFLSDSLNHKRMSHKINLINVFFHKAM